MLTGALLGLKLGIAVYALTIRDFFSQIFKYSIKIYTFFRKWWELMLGSHMRSTHLFKT